MLPKAPVCSPHEWSGAIPIQQIHILTKEMQEISTDIQSNPRGFSAKDNLELSLNQCRMQVQWASFHFYRIYQLLKHIPVLTIQIYTYHYITRGVDQF